MTLKETIMNRICEFRLQNHLSLEEMAYKCGIDKDTLARVGQEDYNPSLDTLQYIAAWMGITVSQLIKMEPEAVYQVVRDTAPSDIRFPFGVQACSNGKSISEVMDLFPDLEEAEEFVSMCNAGMLAACQLADVAADWVQKKYS